MPLEPNELFPEVPNLYEFPSVHCDMIHDLQRVNAYDRAIRLTVKPGDVVADIGTGTGLLAFLALKAGAARVHAIERSPVIECAEELAQQNGFADRIVFHRADSRDTDIGESADVLVSELIGHIAFEEGMIETLSDATQRFLKPNGAAIPQRVTLFAAPVSEREVYRSCIDAWAELDIFDYTPMRRRALQTSYITDLSERDLMAAHKPIFSVDVARADKPELRTEVRFAVLRPGLINGVALWFDAELTDAVRLSSGPWSKTHWKQCFAPISDPVAVETGDEVDVSIDMRLRTRSNDRFVFSSGIAKRRVNGED